MLNKSNRKLYRSLRGEYKRYARRLKNFLFDRRCGTDAINESLCDIFTMLAESQKNGRVFSDVIPDPEASIRETALCFPARRMRRRPLTVLVLSVVAVACAACARAFTLLPLSNFRP